MKSKRFCGRFSIVGSAFLFGIVFLVSACSNNDDQASGDNVAAPSAGQAGTSGVEIDPCTLVTEEDAAEALGADLQATEKPPEANNQYLATCRYIAPRGQGVAVLVVMVHSPDTASRAFQAVKEQPFEIQEVPGIGDDAFWMEGVETLYVLEGSLFLSIGGDIQPEQMQGLATKALERGR